MALNNDGNLLDSSGNVVVDFVWGPFPMQPNDERNVSDWATPVTTEVVANNASENKSWSGYSVHPSVRLNPTLGNHAVVEAKYAGFPSFTGNDDGAYVSGVAFVSVPNVLGLTTAIAVRALEDAGYEAASITTAAGAANSIKTVTAAARTALATATTITAAAHGYVAGNKVVLSGIDASVDGTYTGYHCTRPIGYHWCCCSSGRNH
jgi:hypothetical protein